MELSECYSLSQSRTVPVSTYPNSKLRGVPAWAAQPGAVGDNVSSPTFGTSGVQWK